MNELDELRDRLGNDIDIVKEVLIMKRNFKLIAVLLFFLALIILITINMFPRKVEHRYYLMQMKGETQQWRIEDYQVAITPNFSAAGSAKVYFLGDLSQINNEIQVEFYNDFFTPQITGPYSTGIGAIGEKGYFETGGGGFGGTAQKMTLHDIGNTYAKITWNDKNNQQHSEIIQLEIDNRFAAEIESS